MRLHEVVAYPIAAQAGTCATILPHYYSGRIAFAGERHLFQHSRYQTITALRPRPKLPYPCLNVAADRQRAVE